MNVVVVESPAKAKTINRYLGSSYKVLASYGHVRDLPSKDGSVRPDQDFAMQWSVDPAARANISKIATAAKAADQVYLATDPDREGEAIAWHILEILKERRIQDKVGIKRVVFHEVTKGAVTRAMADPRDVNQALVEAYLARRALDYLVGFSLSPVLWRKLPGSKSAGRVQSVALKLVCERETELELFKPREYWTVEAVMETVDGKELQAQLTHLAGARLKQFDLGDEEAAKAAVAEVERHDFTVGSVESKNVQRRPAPPFTTSTLQQEASRKLGFGASQTMRLAQRLYEGVETSGETGGLITYMRTDSVALSQEAIVAVRAVIGQEYGHTYIPEKPNHFKNRAKNAQEAHEAIRPTDFSRRPERLSLSRDEQRLYELIWKRAVASQMANAQLRQTAVDLVSPDGEVILRASGSVMKFDGFMRLYLEGSDDRDGESSKQSRDRLLPQVSEGDTISKRGVSSEQHFTKPPPRFTEASLVKKLEELGIGRPSTYASILQVLKDRDYVTLDNRKFVPSDLGRLVTAFLGEFFHRYVENDFTAKLEDSLDDVSNGNMEWKVLLAEFWQAFSAAIDSMDELRTRDVIEKLDSKFGSHFFPERSDGKDPRICPACGTGRLGLKPKGFIGCSNYPDCRYSRSLGLIADDQETAKIVGPKNLGEDPDTGLSVTLRNGPYGPYVQLGEAAKGTKPRRQSLLEGMSSEDVDLDRALSLLSLPREVGKHPETSEMILAGVGRYGPYLKIGSKFVNLRDDDVLTIGLNRAVAIIADAPQRKSTGNGKELGKHPEDGKPVELLEGRYGPYVRHGRVNATLPKDLDPSTIGLDRAIELIVAKAAKKTGSRRKTTRRKSPAKGRDA